MLQIVRRNFPLKVLSLVLAVAGWGYFRFAANPAIAARFTQQLAVPLAVVNARPGYVIHGADRQAAVTMETKAGQAPIKPEEVKAVLDVAQRPAGVYNIPVQLVAPNVAVESLSPASVTVTIERIEQRQMAFALHYEANQSPNVVVNHVRFTPAVAAVRGPTSALARVVGVRVDVPLAGDSSGLDAMIHALPVDERGEVVPDVSVIPNLVRVQADFAPASGKGR